MSENDVNWTKPRQSFKIKKGGSYKKSTDRKEVIHLIMNNLQNKNVKKKLYKQRRRKYDLINGPK